MLLQQELQNPYWCLHDPNTTKTYQISSEMDVETMPHAMYFSGSNEAVTKFEHVPYQTIEYDDKGMFWAKLIDDTQVQIFIHNGATPSILPLSIYNKYPILQKYPKMESYTPIHTGGGMIEYHFWIEIPLKLDNKIIQIKALVCGSECPNDIVPGHTSLAQLMARLCFQAVIHTTNFYTTNCEEQCLNITWQDRYYIFGTKTEQDMFCPMPYNHWKRHCIH